MRRRWAFLGSAIFLFAAPGTVAGLVPWWITKWQSMPPSAGLASFRWAGIAVIVAGVVPLVHAFARFAWQGFGTPAPIAPPTRLVVSGCYRHVRNPMYVAVLVVLIGEGILFAAVGVLVWAAVFWLICNVFVLGYEEPVLARRFGENYDLYRANVPRWIPRLVPWRCQRFHV